MYGRGWGFVWASEFTVCGLGFRLWTRVGIAEAAWVGCRFCGLRVWGWFARFLAVGLWFV